MNLTGSWFPIIYEGDYHILPIQLDATSKIDAIVKNIFLWLEKMFFVGIFFFQFKELVSRPVTSNHSR